MSQIPFPKCTNCGVPSNGTLIRKDNRYVMECCGHKPLKVYITCQCTQCKQQFTYDQPNVKSICPACWAPLKQLPI